MKDKIVNIEDSRYLKTVNSIPKEYSINIIRSTKSLDNVERKWDEEFEWSVDEEILDHPMGDLLIFSHLLSILDIMQEQIPELREELKTYMTQEFLEEIENDRNFNI